MARLKCTCGAGMSNSDVPSNNILSVFNASDIDLTLKNTPSISLFDYETSRDNNYEYWRCSVCKRVHVVENVPNGIVVTVFKVSGKKEVVSIADEEAIYVFSAPDIYDAEEDNFSVTLAEYIEKNGSDHLYYINTSKDKVYDSEGNLIYEKEEWSTSVENSGSIDM